MGGALTGGSYKGKDEQGGWGDYGPQMREKGEKSLESWKGEQSYTPEARYGIGKQLEESGIEYGFNPMDFGSISEALAKKQFGEMVSNQISGQGGAPNIYGYDSIWGFADPSRDLVNPFKPKTWGKGGRYAEIGEEDIADYWDHWKENEADMGIFEGQAKAAGIGEQEIAGLDPGASKWRRMENPLMAEATDVYRGGLGQTMAGLGNIRTGSAAKRRKELLQDYGQSVFDIKGKTSSARGKESDRLASRIQKLFQS